MTTAGEAGVAHGAHRARADCTSYSRLVVCGTEHVLPLLVRHVLNGCVRQDAHHRGRVASPQAPYAVLAPGSHEKRQCSSHREPRIGH